MKLIVRAWFTACAVLMTLPVAQIGLAQSVISDTDVARLRAFIGENDLNAGAPSAVAGSASSSVGLAVDGTYKVRPGDTLSEIMAVHVGDTGVNHDVLQKVIVRTNKSAFRRGNPHWLMAGANLRLPTVTDVMDYVVPGTDSKKHSSSGDDWIRFP